MESQVIKRLHVGNLTPSITPTHIRDRFASFGRVIEIEQLGNDALGMSIPLSISLIWSLIDGTWE